MNKYSTILIIGILIVGAMFLFKGTFEIMSLTPIPQDLQEKYHNRILLLPPTEIEDFQWKDVVALKLNVVGCTPEIEDIQLFESPKAYVNSIQLKTSISLPEERLLQTCSEGRDSSIVEISKNTLGAEPTIVVLPGSLKIISWDVEYFLNVECLKDVQCTLQDVIGKRDLACNLDTYTCVAREEIEFERPEVQLLKFSNIWWIILLIGLAFYIYVRRRK